MPCIWTHGLPGKPSAEPGVSSPVLFVPCARLCVSPVTECCSCSGLHLLCCPDGAGLQDWQKLQLLHPARGPSRRSCLWRDTVPQVPIRRLEQVLQRLHFWVLWVFLWQFVVLIANLCRTDVCDVTSVTTSLFWHVVVAH